MTYGSQRLQVGFGYGGNSKAARNFIWNMADPLPLSLQSQLEELCPLFIAPSKQHQAGHCEWAEKVVQSKPGWWQSISQGEEADFTMKMAIAAIFTEKLLTNFG